MILASEDASRNGSIVSSVVLDRFTQWLQAYADKYKDGGTCEESLKIFLGPQVRAEHMYSDGSKEFAKAANKLKITHDRSTPHRPQTNGEAERAVRKVKEGTIATLQQSGLNHLWWAEAQSCFCFLHNFVDPQRENQTPYFQRFGVEFNGPKIAFGALLMYKPANPDLLSKQN